LYKKGIGEGENQTPSPLPFHPFCFENFWVYFGRRVNGNKNVYERRGRGQKWRKARAQSRKVE
jgi:hypothetical protein